MQYHYVVGYDSESMRWFIEHDTTAYFPDGNVWDDNQYKESFYGWKVPEDGVEEELDNTLLRTLGYLTDTFPVPQEVTSG